MSLKETNDLKKLCIVASIAVAVIVAVWGLLLNFFLLYYLQEAYESPVNNTNLQIGNSSSSSCFPDVYTGAVCRDTLQLHQQCLANSYSGSEVYIPSDRDQQQLEQQVTLLIAGLQSLTPSPECSEAAIPLICLFYFGLCDSSGELQLPSATQCETVSNRTCAREFQLASAILSSDVLPGCENFSTSGSTFCASNSSNSSGGGLDTTCQVDFFSDGGVCKPKCGRWSIYSSELATAISVLVFISTAVGIISGTAVFIFSVIRYKKMFKFPSIIVVYQTIDVVLFSLVFLISRADSAFYCSSDDLIDSYNNGSPFCTFVGAVFSYTMIQLAIWVPSHVIILFWGIAFPFHYRAFERRGRLKYIHITEVVVALILPSVPVGIALGTGGFIYDGIPPLVCLPKNVAVDFYAFLLPSAVLMVTGGTFLVLIVWKLIKEHIRKHKQPVITDVKVLVITSYFLFFNFYANIVFSTRLRLWPDGRLMQELTNYFLCESTGLSTCDRTEIDEYSSQQILLNSLIILLGIFPAINLLYAWNYRDIKHIWRNSQIINSLLHSARSHPTDSVQKTSIKHEIA